MNMYFNRTICGAENGPFHTIANETLNSGQAWYKEQTIALNKFVKHNEGNEN